MRITILSPRTLPRADRTCRSDEMLASEFACAVRQALSASIRRPLPQKVLPPPAPALLEAFHTLLTQVQEDAS